VVFNSCVRGVEEFNEDICKYDSIFATLFNLATSFVF
jgi:hypothetical protein